MTNSEAENETPGFRNYDKWIEGYHPLLKWIINELKCIRTNEPTTTKEEWSEVSSKLTNSLLKGAAALQYVHQDDFYHNDEDIEILIRFKNYKNDMKKQEITWDLMKDVILILEQERHQFERIATSYEGK